MQFTPSGGRITVGAQSAPLTDDSGAAETVLLWVSDSGPGIPPEAQARVFEPFVRLQPGQTSEQREGLGLGLAIVQRYTQLHGGCAWMSSTPGQGSTFYIRLPRRIQTDLHHEQMPRPTRAEAR